MLTAIRKLITAFTAWIASRRRPAEVTATPPPPTPKRRPGRPCTYHLDDRPATPAERQQQRRRRTSKKASPARETRHETRHETPSYSPLDLKEEKERERPPTPIEKDWIVDARGLTLARSAFGANAELEIENFRDWALATGALRVDWQAQFRWHVRHRLKEPQQMTLPLAQKPLVIEGGKNRGRHHSPSAIANELKSEHAGRGSS